jgi:hypothetical protein
MNAAHVTRIAKAERTLIEGMSDAELLAIAPGPALEWVARFTDAELEVILDGGPTPARLSHLANDKD